MFARHISLFLFLLIVISTFPVAAADKGRPAEFYSPYIEYPYNPKGDVVVARYEGGDISDLDLYIFLLMAGEEEPHVYDLFNKAERESQRIKYSKKLQNSVRQFAYLKEMSKKGRLRETVPGVLNHLRRYAVLPIAEWVWIKEVLEPQIVIHPTDRISYFRDNKSEFVKNRRVQVRMIYRSVEPNATKEVENETESAMKRFRDSIAEGKITFEEIAETYSDSPSAVDGGLLPPLEKGKYDYAIEEVAFKMEMGEISQVFKGPGGYFILKAEKEFPYEEKSIEEVKEEIDEDLYELALKELHDFKFTLMTRWKATTFDTGNIFHRPPDQNIIEVGKLKIKVKQFLEMFPDIYKSPTRLNGKLFKKIVYRFHDGELVAEELQELGFQNDSRIKRALEMADMLIRADEAYRQNALTVSVEMSESDVQTYYETNKIDFIYEDQYRVFEVIATPGNIATLSPQAFVSSQKEYEKALADLIKELGPKTKNYVNQRARWENQNKADYAPDYDLESSPVARLQYQERLLVSPRFFREFDRYNTDDVSFSIKDKGYFYKKANYKTWKIVRSQDVGTFSNPVRIGTAYISYYLDRTIPGRPADVERIRHEIRQSLIEERISKAIDLEHKRIIDADKIEYLFDPDATLELGPDLIKQRFNLDQNETVGAAE